MTPTEAKACSVWELSAAFDGWAKAHAPKVGLSDDEREAAWAAVQAKMGRVNG